MGTLMTSFDSRDVWPKPWLLHFEVFLVACGYFNTGFPLTLEKLENLEKGEKFFQSGKSQGILEFHQKVREKSGNFLSVREN